MTAGSKASLVLGFQNPVSEFENLDLEASAQ